MNCAPSGYDDAIGSDDGVLNIGGYFDPLVRLIDHAIEAGFIKREHRDLIVVEERPDLLLSRLATHRMPVVHKWIGRDEI